MANAANLINFGSGGAAVGDTVYSTYALTAPSYLPLNDDTATYLTSSYPTLGATFASATVAYATATKTVPVTGGIWNFVFGNNTFLGWDTGGNIITSTDGTTWLRSAINTDYVTSGTTLPNASPALVSGNWQQMVYGNGKFIAVRYGPIQFGNGSNSVQGMGTSIGATAISNDNGQTWVQGTVPNSAYNFFGNNYNLQFQWSSIGYAGTRFVILGWGYDGSTSVYNLYVAYSVNGIEWSSSTNLGSIGTTAGYSGMAFGNNVVVSIQLKQPTSTVYVAPATSTSIFSFGAAGFPVSQCWKSVAFGNGVFVAVGAGAVNNNTTDAATSTNGSSWTARVMPASLVWQSVTFSNGYFVAVGQDYAGVSNTNNIATSTDGITWTLRAAPTAVLSRGVVAGGNGKFIYSDLSTANIGVLSFSVSSASFSLPMVAPIKAMTPYIKAS